MNGIALLQGEVITKEWKYTENFLKIFSRTSKPNSIKLGTNYPWLKGIQVCSNKGPGSLQREDNHKNVNIGCRGATIHRGTPKTAIRTAKSNLNSLQSRFGLVQNKCTTYIFSSSIFSMTYISDMLRNVQWALRLQNQTKWRW
jgi:hypothetical protein